MIVTNEALRNIKQSDEFKAWKIQRPPKRLLEISAHFLGDDGIPQTEAEKRDLTELLLLEKMA